MPAHRVVTDDHYKIVHSMRMDGLSFLKIAESDAVPNVHQSSIIKGYRGWCEREGLEDGMTIAHKSPHKHSNGVTTTGVHVDYETISPADLWDIETNANKKRIDKALFKKRQQIVLPNEPCAIAFMSDFHLENSHCDLEQLRFDSELIANTPNFYAIHHGDFLDGYVVGKLVALNLTKKPVDVAWKLLRHWLEMMRDSLLAVCLGNHDAWTPAVAGMDPFKMLFELEGIRCLYDSDQIEADLVQGDTVRKLMVRHQWKYKSILNPFHGAQRHGERFDDFSVAVTGHLHVPAYAYVPMRGEMKHIIQTGTYKHDQFARKLGYGPHQGTGSAALVFVPGKEPVYYADLTEAARAIRR